MPAIVSRIVEVCIFSFSGAGPEYLLLRRSPSEQIYPGIWQFVSGSVEGAETALAAARREMAEETALPPLDFWVVPHVNVFYDPSRDAVNLTPVFAARVAPGSEPKLSTEHSEYLWCDYTTALGKLVWPGQREALRILQEYVVRGSQAAGRSRIV
ncbi:MAG TPA: NUDIX pyrophosphatase [Bacteroidota bacterium]|nr:NUDIX pyrophosphatase [Bacteroidota bacterium]